MQRPPPPQTKRAVNQQKGSSVIGTTPDPKVPETRDWLTRNEASDMLSCSSQTLANYERKGLLHPQHAYRPDGRGAEHRVIVYNPHELTKLAGKLHRHILARDPGELAGRAYEMYDEGRSEREIVRELRLTPDAVQVLHDKWLDGGGADRVVTPSAWEALEGTIGLFKSVTELVECVTQLKDLEKVLGPFKGVSELVMRVTKLVHVKEKRDASGDL
jgi:hypothetical protein